MDKYNLYDKIVARSINDLLNIEEQNKYIVVNDANMNDFLYEMLNLAKIFSSNLQVYIRSGFIRYFWLKRKYKKLNLKWTITKKDNANETELLKRITEDFETTDKIFEDIYNDYYKGK